MNQKGLSRLHIPFYALAVAVLVSCTVATNNVPSDLPSVPVDTTFVTDTSIDFRDPSVPSGGGTGLPDTNYPSNDVEVDCENAEDLCESGEWACDDIADYCDIGPDGGELPEDWDWDQ